MGKITRFVVDLFGSKTWQKEDIGVDKEGNVHAQRYGGPDHDNKKLHFHDQRTFDSDGNVTNSSGLVHPTENRSWKDKPSLDDQINDAIRAKKQAERNKKK